MPVNGSEPASIQDLRIALGGGSPRMTRSAADQSASMTSSSRSTA